MPSRYARKHALRPEGLLATLLGGLLLCPGCHQAADPDAGPSPLATLNATPDRPSTLPAAAALFTTVLPPASPPERQVEQAVLPPRPPDPATVARQAADFPPVVPTTTLPPHAATPDAGLIVCDPVSSSPNLTKFGSACGRWLDLVAAGQPELGRTPLWESRRRAEHEMGRTDFSLSPAQAAALAAMTGATHAACGMLDGTPEHCTLTYTLYRLPGGAPLGVPLVRTGSEEQLLAALPEMARVLDTRLGVPTPQVPSSVGLTTTEVIRLETISRGSHPSDADLSFLAGASARSPLSAIVYLDTRACYDAILLRSTVRTLLTQMPGNALALSHIGFTYARALRPYASATHILISHYPKNALLAHTDVWQQRVWGTRSGELAASQRTSRDAPGDPDAWLTLSYTLSDISEDLRQARLASDISTAEWTTLNRLYDRMEAASLRATTLDPHDGHAWLRLAQAATLMSDTTRTTSSLNNALALDPDKNEVFGWGLQMEQPKWHGDPAELGRIAALATAEPWDDSGAATGIAVNLRSAGLDAQADSVLASFIARERGLIAKTPTNAMTHWNLAEVLAAQDTRDSLREASLEYRVAEHLMPNVAEIHRLLGSVLDRRHKPSEAIDEYRQSLALDPFSPEAHSALGYDLKHQHRFAEALSELHLAMRLDPHNAEAHTALGDLYEMQHRPADAAAEYREAIRMNYYELAAWITLPGALDDSGKYDASLAAGREADRLITELQSANTETKPPLHDTMADDYLHKKEWDSSIAESNVALSYSPSDAVAHENLAEAYCGQGQMALARAEWTKTIALGNPDITPVARKLLAAHS